MNLWRPVEAKFQFYIIKHITSASYACIKQTRHDDVGSSTDTTAKRIFVLTCLEAATWQLGTWHKHELLKDHGPLSMIKISISIAYAHHDHAQQAGVRFLPVSSNQWVDRQAGSMHSIPSGTSHVGICCLHECTACCIC